jgi:PPM family protein phosphatase
MSWKKLFGNKNSQANEKKILPAAPIDLKVAVVTDLGNIRTNNEDTGLFFRVADPQVTREKGALLMVADGMGGHAAGEVASKMAADTITKEYFKNGTAGNIEKSLSKIFALANKNIYGASSANQALRGMGTTCTALVVVDKLVYYAHVGDSRAYMVKKDSITRITTDHTYVQQLVQEGQITAAEAEEHPQRNILTNAMGTKPQIRIDTGRFYMPFEENDTLLVCSDGLYDYLEDAEIAAMVNGNSPQEAADALVAEAKKRGGHDNITVVLAAKTGTAATSASKETRDFVLPVTKEIDLP